MTLHICNKSPGESIALQSCLKIATASTGNAVLLIEDGVYALLPAQLKALGLAAISADTALYALQEDIAARGLKHEGRYIKSVDYAKFVQLCAEHQNSHSWY